MVGGCVPGFGRIVWIGETFLEGGAEVELENGLRVEVFPDAFGEPVYFAWDRNRADAPVELDRETVDCIVREAIRVCEDDFARQWLEKWIALSQGREGGKA